MQMHQVCVRVDTATVKHIQEPQADHQSTDHLHHEPRPGHKATDPGATSDRTKHIGATVHDQCKHTQHIVATAYSTRYAPPLPH